MLAARNVLLLLVAGSFLAASVFALPQQQYDEGNNVCYVCYRFPTTVTGLRGGRCGGSTRVRIFQNVSTLIPIGGSQ